MNRIFNTWVGEPSKLILLKAVLDTIVQEKLLAQVTEVGQQLQTGLADLSTRHPGLLANVRGRGTFCAVDCDTAARRERIVAEMRRLGVHLGVCGDTAIRFRPTLTFDQKHLGILLDRLDTVLTKVA